MNDNARREIHRVTVNGRACERISFANGETLYFARSADVRFPTFRLVPKVQHKFRAAIDRAINGDLTGAPKSG